MKIHLKSVSFHSLFLFLLTVFFALPVQASDEFPEAPNQVKNVVVEVENGQVDITWDKAIDPDGVITGYKLYYGTQSVQAEDDFYDDELEVGNVTSYTLQGLTNDETYYFAVTAVDDEGLESENYSVEVSGMPEDKLAKLPKLVDVQQLTETLVELTFSETVLLKNGKNSLIVTEKETSAPVAIVSADLQKNKVLLEFLGLTPGTLYKVQATSTVEDEEGNPVAEGVMDTVEFVSQDFSVPEEAIETPPEDIENLMEELMPLEALEESGVSFAAEPETTPIEEDAVPLSPSNLKINSSRLEDEGVVLLQWNKAMDIEEDIIDQVLYTRQGNGAWDGGYSLGADISELEIEVDMDENYEVKLVTVDAGGQESEGTILKFSTHLAQTGPSAVGTVVTLGVAFFLGLTILGRRRAY